MSRGAPFGFGPLPTVARQDDPGLGPEMIALLRESRGADPAPGEVPAAVPPGFTGFTAPSPPTGAPTPVVDTSGARAVGERAADVREGFADMGRRTADLFGRLRSGEIDPGAFAKAAGAHLAGQAFETARSAAMAPRDAISGDLPIFDPATGHVSEEAMNRSAGLAGLAMTGSLPFSAPAGALRTFGGRAAATADHAALDRAAAMQAGGASPEAIWGTTGWGLGKDGVARFEIPDDGARLRPHDGSGSTTLGQVLDHPRLFEAYPEMRDTQVFHRPELGSDAAANPAKNWIAANLDDAQVLPALLHEGQHIVQRREGFAPGASPIDPALAAHPQVAEVASLRQRLSGLADPQAEALASRADQAARLEAYRTAAGEVEARNVEARQGMTPAERAATPPWQTQDVPSDRQWLPRSGGVTGDAAQLKIDPSHALYSGGPAGAVSGPTASTLAAPADAQAAPSSTASPRGSAMTFGIPFGFGAMPIPNANPDDAQRLLQRLPFDPSQAPNLVPAADLSGPAGALVHHPNWKTLGQQAAQDDTIAMDEAGTQRMERQAGMMPGQDAAAAPRSPMPGAADLARLFDQRPMGAAQGFAGTSGTIVPETPGQSPSPGQMPAPGQGAPSATPPRRVFGALAIPGGDDAADTPAPGAIPAAGQAPPGIPRVPGGPSNGAPGGVPLATQAFGGATQAPATPAPAASGGGSGAAPASAGGGFDLGGALDRFGRNGGYDTLTNLGIGLMSTRGLGPGLAVGMKLDQDAGAKRAATDLARAEFALKSRKAQQEQAVQNMTARAIMSKMPETSAEDAVALAGNPEFVKSFMSSHYGAPEGFVRTATGLQPVAGGPQDTATLKARAQAQAEGTAAGTKDDVQLQTLPDGRVIAVNKSNLFPAQGEEAKPVVTQVAASQGVVPLTSTNDRLSAGIRQDDKRAAWRRADGEVTFEPTPPSTNINMPPTEKAEQSAIGTARAGIVKEHIEAGRAARDKIQILDQMRGALDEAGPNMMTGPLGEPVLRAKQALGGMLGAQLPGTSATEMFANSGPVLAGAAARAITARPAQIEFTTMLNAKPGLMNSPEGNRASMDVMRQSAVRDADLSDIAARSSSVDEFIRKRDEYEEAHPMINPFTGKPFGSATPASPTPLGAQGATAPTLSDLQAEARKRGLIR